MMTEEILTDIRINLGALHEKVDRIDKSMEKMNNVLDEMQKTTIKNEVKIKNVEDKVESLIQKSWGLAAGILLAVSGTIVNMMMKK